MRAQVLWSVRLASPLLLITHTKIAALHATLLFVAIGVWFALRRQYDGARAAPRLRPADLAFRMQDRAYGLSGCSTKAHGVRLIERRCAAHATLVPLAHTTLLTLLAQLHNHLRANPHCANTADGLRISHASLRIPSPTLPISSSPCSFRTAPASIHSTSFTLAHAAEVLRRVGSRVIFSVAGGAQSHRSVSHTLILLCIHKYVIIARTQMHAHSHALTRTRTRLHLLTTHTTCVQRTGSQTQTPIDSRQTSCTSWARSGITPVGVRPYCVFVCMSVCVCVRAMCAGASFSVGCLKRALWRRPFKSSRRSARAHSRLHRHV